MNTVPERLDAVVADASQRQALVALRALGREGLVCGTIDSDPASPAFASRWCSVGRRVPEFARDQDAYVDAVLAFCSDHQPRALIPAHDGSIEALRRRRSEVEAAVGLALPPEDALTIAIDKVRTLAIAERLGLRAPRGAAVTDVDDAAAVLELTGLPAVIKPVRSWVQDGSVGLRLTSRVATTRDEGRAAIELIVGAGGAAVVQEWLPGDRVALSFMYAHGRVWARFAQRADRTTPPLGGNSVRRDSIPFPEDIAAASERLVAELGLDGYSEVEFRRDAAGEAVLMEINPRLSASVEIAVRAGVPFPRLLYRWAAGLPLEQVSGYRTGMTMRWLGGDIEWLRSAFGEPGRPDVPTRSYAVTAFLTDFLRPMGYDYMDKRDLRPARIAFASAAKDFGESATRKVKPRAATTAFDTDVAVIGAGPYGLSVSAHLSDRGVRHVIFGEPMDLWRSHMPPGMYLKSEGFASNLSDPSGEHTLERYCAEAGIEYGAVATPIALDTFVGYGDWFRERAVPQLRTNRVDRVRAVDGGFELTLDSGESLTARRVVVATGLQPFPHVPPELAALPPGVLAHSFDDPSVEALKGKDVLIVGLGQSALEAAALLHEANGRVRVLARAPEIAWNSRPEPRHRPLRERVKYPRSGLGDGVEQYLCANHPLVFGTIARRRTVDRAFTALGPAGAWWLKPRYLGQVETLLARRIVEASASNGGAVLRVEGPDGQEELHTEHVMAATGYRLDVARLKFLDPEVRNAIATREDKPILDRWFESSVPRLHFVGFPAAATFGPLMRFVFGTEFAAGRVARRAS